MQFYKATSNGVVSEQDVQEIAEQIQRVYEDADYVGSLVVSGETGRPTEYEGPKQEPPGWWDAFWQRFEGNTGMDRQDAYALWLRLRMNAGTWFHITQMIVHIKEIMKKLNTAYIADHLPGLDRSGSGIRFCPSGCREIDLRRRAGIRLAELVVGDGGPVGNSPSHGGTHSIAVTFGAWEGLYLHKADIDTLGTDRLRFYIHGGGAAGSR